MARCKEETSHHPMDYPWAITVRCTQKAGHHNLEGKARVHRGRDYGHTIMWLTEPDLLSA